MKRKHISRIISFAMVTVMTFTSTDVFAAVRSTEAQSEIEVSDEEIMETDDTEGQTVSDNYITADVASYGLSNPRRDDNGVVIWDCVYFGSYAQAEVVADKSTYTAIGSSYLSDGDIIDDSGLYSKLQSASFNDKGFATVTYSGSTYTYKRINKENATYGTSGSSAYYNWSDSTTWHYFRCEPIKWRVLSVNGSDAFLLADKGLDDQEYNKLDTFITWETSTIRSWLNGYGSTVNTEGTDYSSNGDNFIDTAFTSGEKGAIKTTSVVNADNTYYGSDGGNDTLDKVFLLSESEVYSTSNGFSSDYITEDKCRRIKSSTYAKAMGTVWNTSDDYRGNCWWLRSPGGRSITAASVDYSGDVDRYGNYVSDDDYAARPALHINLSSNLWTPAGKANSEGIEYEPKVELNTVSANILINKTETLTATAYDKYGEAIENPEFSWSSSDESIATVISGVVRGISPGPATITATYQGKTAECAVTVTREKKEPTISLNTSSITIEAGKGETLTVTATDEYGDLVSNSSVSWNSSDESIATVDNGEVTGISPGPATITATYKGKTAECSVTVIEAETEWLKYFEKTGDTTYTLNLAVKQKYVASEFKKVRGVVPYKITESKADKKIATLSSKGIFIAKKAGTATITLMKGTEEYTITVNVYNPQYSAKTYAMNVGETKVLGYSHCNLKPEFSISNKQLEKATVSTLNTGVPSVDAKKRGTVTVTAVVGNGIYARKATAKVVIYDPQIKFAGNKTTVKKGKYLSASIKYGAKGTQWSSSDENIASINSKGRIRGIAPGKAIITAVNNGKIVTKEITVE